MTMTDRARPLPPNLPPRLLSRDQAAEYCGGISAPHFDATIGTEVKPIEVGRRKLWDVRALDRYLDVKSGLIEEPLEDASHFINRLGAKSGKRHTR